MDRIIGFVKANLFWVCTFLLLVIFFILVPLTGDDFTFLAYHNSIHGLQGYIDANGYMYNHLNGRIIGNMSSLILVKSTIFSAIIRAGIVLFILYSTCRLLRIKQVACRNMIIILLLFVPIGIFHETYAWRAGFYNYVTPVAFIAAIYWIASTQKKKEMHVVCLFALSIAVGLFVENITLGWVVITLAVLLFSAWQKRELLMSSIAIAAGSLSGAFIMFGSPIYRTITSGGDTYRKVGGGNGGGGLLHTVRDNMLPYTELLLGKYVSVVIILSILSLLLIVRG